MPDSRPPGQRGAAFIHDLTLEGDGEEMAGVSISLENKRNRQTAGRDRGGGDLGLGNSPRPTPRGRARGQQVVALGLRFGSAHS
jgi:hypothetical protein